MSMTEAAEARGRAGENAVCEYLEENGARILKRNFRIKHGEIDIISTDGEFIIFTEVKTRKYGAYEDGTGAMTKVKMKRIIAASERFVELNPEYEGLYRRFDTAYVTVTTEKYPRILDIEYYKSGFTALSCR